MTSLTLVRRIKARPEIVFEAITTAEGIAHWWGPDAGPVLIADVDARPGGRYRVRFRLLDGSEHEAVGNFVEIVAPSRVVMSWRWNEGGSDSGESRIEYMLRAVPEGTELTFTHAQLQDEESARAHEGGWTGALDKLQVYLERSRS